MAPEHENELFIRLALYSPGEESLADPALAFTMPVSDLLRMLYEICDDVREIVNEDIRQNSIMPPSDGVARLN